MREGEGDVSLLGAEWLGRLRSMYGQAHRRYHTEAHVRAMLSLISAHESELRDPRALRLAAWFHECATNKIIFFKKEREHKGA